MAYQLQLKNGTLAEWVEENPVLAEAEPGVILGPSGNIVIGDGKSRYKDLPSHAWGQDAYDILVKYGGYKGTKEDFCRQLNSSLRMPEQQAGILVNAGAGWNAFSFPKEFSEDVYVVLTPQDAAVFASVKNITKQGFHYCLYDAAGETVGSNVVVNYMATAVSELNMAQAIAQAAGLNPFDFDNLTDLFASHAAEVVGSAAAFNIAKRSGMAAGRYLCHLTGLNPVTYHNIVSLAGDESAMNTIAVTEEAVTFIVMAPGAYDSIRLGTMPMAKYLVGLLSLSPEGYSTVTGVLDDSTALTALVADKTAMQAFVGSEIGCSEMVVHPTACSAVAGSDIAMQAVAGSDIAMQAVAGSEHGRAVLRSSSLAWKVVLSTDAFVAKYALGVLENVSYKPSNYADMAAIVADQHALGVLAGSEPAMTVLAGSEPAMTVLAGSEPAMTVLAGSEPARDILYNNSISWDILSKKDMAIAKYAIGCLNNSSYKPANFASMSSVISNSAALAALANSSTAMSALANSSTAMSALANSSTAMSALYNHASVVEPILLGSTTAKNELLKVATTATGSSQNYTACSGKCLLLTLNHTHDNSSYYNTISQFVISPNTFTRTVAKAVTNHYRFASQLKWTDNGHGGNLTAKYIAIN